MIDETLEEELKDLRVPFFMAFGKEDLQMVCHALHGLQADRLGAARTSRYQETWDSKVLMANYREAYDLWRTARAAYQKQYKIMP